MRVLAVVGVLVICISCAGWRGAWEAQAPQPVQPVEQPTERESSAPPEPQVFEVSEEVYSRTFDEIGDFINNLNRIIREQDFQTWLGFLSEDYIRTTSDPEYLRKQSEKPLLKQNNVELKSLEDYFIHVVVPSRSQAQLDDIEFLDEDHVKAISIVRGTQVVLYLLVRDQGSWKIGVW
jgi:hypothetical protein